MGKKKISSANAELEFALLSAEAGAFTDTDFFHWLRESGLSAEAALRLKVLIEATTVIKGQVVNIGKLIVMKLIEFVNEHKNLAIGVALGAGIGVLIASVPLIGPLLSPIATVIGISIGAFAGHRLDLEVAGTAAVRSGKPIDIGQDLIEIARAFFTLLVDIFNIVLTGAINLQGSHEKES